MPSMKQLTTGVIVTVAGVAVAGFLFNAFRDTDFVKSIINGFDA